MNRPLAGRDLQSFAQDSCRLWSLWEMLSLYAHSFFGILRMLRESTKQFEQIVSQDPNATAPLPIVAGGKPTIVEVGLQNALNLSNELGLRSVMRQVITLHTAMVARHPLVEFVAEIKQLGIRLEEDLGHVHFLYVPFELVPYWNEPNLFGDAMATKFEDAAADIESAGKCLAVGQGTACVFHLMRAMEVAVRKLGRRLNVTIRPNTTWRGITGKMDVKIKSMPESTDGQKRKKNAWEEARANLHHVGSVWRNNTMHPAKSYTPSQALDIFKAVRVFMNGLCEL
jgi:hypothetical protein